MITSSIKWVNTFTHVTKWLEIENSAKNGAFQFWYPCAVCASQQESLEVRWHTYPRAKEVWSLLSLYRNQPKPVSVRCQSLNNNNKNKTPTNFSKCTSIFQYHCLGNQMRKTSMFSWENRKNMRKNIYKLWQCHIKECFPSTYFLIEKGQSIHVTSLKWDKSCVHVEM